MAVRLGRSKEKASQAERDRDAQEKVSEVYRDSETQYSKDVEDVKGRDPFTPLD